jgi:hypothetical protein
VSMDTIETLEGKIQLLQKELGESNKGNLLLMLEVEKLQEELRGSEERGRILLEFKNWWAARSIAAETALKESAQEISRRLGALGER